MNRKGIAPALIAPIAIAVIALILTAAFLVSGTLRWTLIGIGIFIGMFWVIGQMVTSDVTKPKIIVILILLAAGSLFVFGGSFLQTAFQPLSISQADVEGEGSRIIIHASTQGANALSIDFTPSQLNRYLEEKGYRATRTSRMTAEILNSDISFPYVTNTDNPVPTISNAGRVSTRFGNPLSACEERFPGTVAVVPGTGFFSADYDCYARVNAGHINSFSTGQSSGDIQVRFNVDGETATISSKQQSVDLAGGRAKISWVGNLLSFTDIGAPQYQVYRLNNEVRLVNGNANGNIQGAYSTALACINRQLDNSALKLISEDSISGCVRPYNQVLNANLDSRANEYLANTANARSLDLGTQGTMKVNTRTPNFIPTFIIELDASKVGLIKLSGEPDIISCAADTTLEGSGTKAVTARVKNAGSQDGFFEMSVQCDNARLDGSAESQSIRAGQTKTVGLTVGGSTADTNDNSGRCTLTVRDRNGGKTDSCSFGVTVEFESFISECNIDGQTICSSDGKSVFTCRDGQYDVALCNSGTSCDVQGGVAQCVAGKHASTAGSASAEALCTAKAEKRPWLGYTIVEKEPNTWEKVTSLWTARSTNQCVAAFLPYYLFGGFILVMGIAIVWLMVSNGKKD